MDHKPFKILFVCVANYCRSPVAEKILKSRVNKNFSVSSCGLQPKIDFKMDPRSKNYLENLKIDEINHSPRKISKNLLEESNAIFAMDIEVFQELKKIYNHEKVKLFSYLNKDFYTPDPYLFNDSEYEYVMSLINMGCDAIHEKIHELDKMHR